MESCNTQFASAGLLGITVLIASGDQGVWGREGTSGNVFHPDFPASSPYVTAVGGTDFATKSTVGTETAWEDGGGGFSDTFSIPSYQSAYVTKYFTTAKSSLPSSAYYNSSGRGYPDVSALAGQVNPYFISYKAGTFTAVAGTSAACPVFAGIVGQLNNVLLSESSPTTLGFMNSWIYANQAAFNDVTSGTNTGGYTYGFTAVAGWDPATGVGTANYASMKAAL